MNIKDYILSYSSISIIEGKKCQELKKKKRRKAGCRTNPRVLITAMLLKTKKINAIGDHRNIILKVSFQTMQLTVRSQIYP